VNRSFGVALIDPPSGGRGTSRLAPARRRRALVSRRLANIRCREIQAAARQFALNCQSWRASLNGFCRRSALDKRWAWGPHSC